MSFRDLEHGHKGHAYKKQQPKQRRQDEDSSFERGIRANVQEMQETVRKASSQLEQAQRSRLSRRGAEALQRLTERGEELSEDTARLFRDWTVHLAGEPTERHRKKFSFEKLQKAFEEEVAQHKDVCRRANMAQQEAREYEARQAEQHHSQASSGFSREIRPVCDEQDASGDAEAGLLDDTEVSCMTTSLAQEDATLRIRNSIAQEREDGIRRIQCQVSEVNQMFRDLASIVAEQGQQFGSIERQAEETVSSTKQAVQELRKAVDRQRGNRERMCCMLVVAVLLLAFVILPHMHMMHPRLGPPSPTSLVATSGDRGEVARHSFVSGRRLGSGFGEQASPSSDGGSGGRRQN